MGEAAWLGGRAADEELLPPGERSPRYAQPVPVGAAELPEAEAAEEATEEEDIVAEPTCTFAQEYGRFVTRYTGLATALGNFEQGSVQTESAAVAHWLTSGLRVAMPRAGWSLLSPRYALTKLPGDNHSRFRLSWFLELLSGCTPSSPPPGGGGWSRSHISTCHCPLQASCDLRPFFKFLCLTRDTIES